MTHCGRQAGGAPSVPGSQEHTARPPSLRHDECGPHGDGKHGSGAGGLTAVNKILELQVSSSLKLSE